MAIRSYSPLYLNDVSDNLGSMLVYADHMGLDLESFWEKFAASTVAREIERGNPRFLAGYSAAELLELVLNNGKDVEAIPIYHPTEIYWAGWILAQYQNYKIMSFLEINKYFPIKKVIESYYPLHEADVTKFFEIADNYIRLQKTETNLRRMRRSAKMSQRKLAEEAEVSIRSIQMYEQRKNDINKAQADNLFRISKVLGCRIEDLFEF